MISILFIDANQYLKLFGLVKGRKLLDLLEAQRNYIFVPAQIVDEILRKKLTLASRFFSQQLRDINETIVPVPDHLLGVDEGKVRDFRRTFEQMRNARNELDDIAKKTLSHISRSKDDVSKRLQLLFDAAVEPTVNEMTRARFRRELGNPPGKQENPLGDQIDWEQLLSHCRKVNAKEIWIITEDRDYFDKYGRTLLINPLLNRDLVAACDGEPNVHCFEDLSLGLTEFAKSVGVNEMVLPTRDEAKEIKKEIDRWVANTSAVTAADLRPSIAGA
jgi:hypothetical protein